jgi:hypothetical protein
MLDAKLNNGKRKTFEVSIMLARGKEHILIGIASLKFVSVLMETEIDIPIHLIASLKAVEINTNAKTRGKAKVFGKSDYNDRRLSKLTPMQKQEGKQKCLENLIIMTVFLVFLGVGHAVAYFSVTVRGPIYKVVL